MVRNVYSIYDKLAEEYGPPVCAKNDAIAMRMFINEIKDPNVRKDYELWYIGEYDDNEGRMRSIEARKKLSEKVLMETEDKDHA